MSAELRAKMSDVAAAQLTEHRRRLAWLAAPRADPTRYAPPGPPADEPTAGRYLSFQLSGATLELWDRRVPVLARPARHRPDPGQRTRAEVAAKAAADRLPVDWAAADERTGHPAAEELREAEEQARWPELVWPDGQVADQGHRPPQMESVERAKVEMKACKSIFRSPWIDQPSGSTADTDETRTHLHERDDSGAVQEVVTEDRRYCGVRNSLRRRIKNEQPEEDPVTELDPVVVALRRKWDEANDWSQIRPQYASEQRTKLVGLRRSRVTGSVSLEAAPGSGLMALPSTG